jgi:hypothetical protein
MKTTEIKTLEEFKSYAVRHFKTLEPVAAKEHIHTAEIRVSSYSELVYIASNMLKLCIFALREDDEPQITHTVKNPLINVVAILEVVAQLIPLEEIELLDVIHELLIDDPNNPCKLNNV